MNERMLNNRWSFDVCPFFFPIHSSAFVISQINECIDPVSRGLRYYVEFIVQRKALDSLIPFYLVLAARLSR